MQTTFTLFSHTFSFTFILLCLRIIQIFPIVAQKNSRQKVMEIIFQWGGGSAWHKGTDKWVPSTTMAAGWPSKSWEQRGWMRADDIPYPNHLTWLVMPTTRSAPLGLSEAEMCVGHSKECTNLLFIKCGVTWEWRLNGDLSMIQLLHRRSHMKLWLFLIRHMGLAKCVKDCD